MGLGNEAVRQHMDALFGKERANRLREQLWGVDPSNREALIVEDLCAALREQGAAYVLPFTFKNESGSRTSHHLIFATKHFRGYEIMKGIMAKESSEHHQGVASFEYSPASEEFPILFGLSRPWMTSSKCCSAILPAKPLQCAKFMSGIVLGRRS